MRRAVEALQGVLWNIAHAALPGTDAFNGSVLILLAVSINASSLEYAVSVHTRLPGCEAPLVSVPVCRLHRTALCLPMPVDRAQGSIPRPS